MNKPLKSTLPINFPNGGIRTSPTREVAIFPKAPPMMIPTARSTTFPRTMNSLNSLIMEYPYLNSIVRSRKEPAKHRPRWFRNDCGMSVAFAPGNSFFNDYFSRHVFMSVAAEEVAVKLIGPRLWRHDAHLRNLPRLDRYADSPQVRDREPMHPVQ